MRLNRKEYAWGLFRPLGIIDNVLTVIALVVIVTIIAIIITPEVWMPDSILKPELRGHQLWTGH